MSNLTQSKKKQNELSILAQRIDATYKEGLFIYSETLSNYALQIEELKSRISFQEEAKHEEEKDLLRLKKEIEQEERFLQKLDENLAKKIHSIDELKTQYADIMQSEEYQKILKRKENELSLDLDEIEELEIVLLQQELECINLLSLLSPKRKEIKKLKEIVKKVKLEKEHFSLKHIQQLPQLALGQDSILETENEIETEVMPQDDLESSRK